ncbi:MAG: DUF89 family protein [Kiritimatiellae bacterium]|nr:DUF89 family protein [Kiritimatiellia bacterium]
MKTEIECIPCFVRQAVEAVALIVKDPARREALLRKLLHEIANSEWTHSPPVMGQRIHRIIRQELGCRDPYRDVKDRMNRIAEELLPSLCASMAYQPDQHEAAVRMAIGGNLLDVGAKTQIAAEDIPRHMNAIWTQPLRGDVDALFRAADEAHCILYLTDNAGETVFDRVLIEALPAEKITVFVRGAPVLNDATMEDAVAAGLSETAPVFDNGSDAPGAILEDCSEEFRRWFERADLIIAKGQGNYETLSDTTKRVFFLFTVKCPVIAAHVGEPVGSLVVKENRDI